MTKNRSHKQFPAAMTNQKHDDRQPAKAQIVIETFTKDAIPVFSKVDATFGQRLKTFVESLPDVVRDFAEQRIKLPPVLSPASMLVAILDWLPPKLQSVANSLRKDVQKFLNNSALVETKLAFI